MFKPRVHEHPRNPDEEVYGEQLEAHDLVDEDADVREDTSGKYLPCKGMHGQRAGIMVIIRRLPEWKPPSPTTS